MLVYHGKTVEQCQWVIKMFEHDPLSKNNLTTQQWIQECKEFLGISQAGKASDFDSDMQWFESIIPSQSVLSTTE